MKIINLEQRSPEWHAYRSTRVGASEAAAVCGLSRYKKPVDVWKEKKLGTTQFETGAMKRGTELEPKVRSIMESLDSCIYSPIVVESKFPWLFASLDGFCEKTGKIIEIKTGSRDIYQKIPIEWEYQVQVQMFCTDQKEATIVFFDGECPYQIRVARDNELIPKIVAGVKDFVTQWLEEESAEDLPKECPDAVSLFMEASSIKEQIDLLNDRYDEILISLKEQAGDKSIYCGPFKFTKYIKQGNVDYKAIPALEGVDLEKYRKDPVTCWRLSV